MNQVLRESVDRELDRLLRGTPAFGRLDPASQTAMRDAMAKISSFLAETHGTPARQFAPDPRTLRSGGVPGGAPAPAVPAPVTAAPVPPGTSPAPGPSAPPGPSGAADRVGAVARSTLNAIDFPSFVASLIQGTFQAIVDASIQQMEAYAQLLKNAALTVDTFMNDNVTDGQARDYLADRHGGIFERDTSGTAPRLTVAPGASSTPMPSFLGDLGISSADDLDNDTVQDQVVPATRRMLAEQRQQTLATMVLMGINRIIVSDGEITARLNFHVDASETTSMRFDQSKQSGMSMSSTAGRNPFSATGIMVNTTALNAQSDLNVRADLLGNVVVRFRSDVMPLERFADSAAIQLINSRARVPSAAAPTEPAATPNGTPPATTPAVMAPPPAPPVLPGVSRGAPPPATAPTPGAVAPAGTAPAPAQQSIDDPSDPWSAR